MKYFHGKWFLCVAFLISSIFLLCMAGKSLKGLIMWQVLKFPLEKLYHFRLKPFCLSRRTPIYIRFYRLIKFPFINLNFHQNTLKKSHYAVHVPKISFSSSCSLLLQLSRSYIVSYFRRLWIQLNIYGQTFLRITNFKTFQFYLTHSFYSQKNKTGNIINDISESLCTGKSWEQLLIWISIFFVPNILFFN